MAESSKAKKIAIGLLQLGAAVGTILGFVFGSGNPIPDMSYSAKWFAAALLGIITVVLFSVTHDVWTGLRNKNLITGTLWGIFSAGIYLATMFDLTTTLIGLTALFLTPFSWVFAVIVGLLFVLMYIVIALFAYLANGRIGRFLSSRLGFTKTAVVWGLRAYAIIFALVFVSNVYTSWLGLMALGRKEELVLSVQGKAILGIFALLTSFGPIILMAIHLRKTKNTSAAASALPGFKQTPP